MAAPCNLDPPHCIWPGAFDGAVVLDGEDVPGNDVPGDAGFVPKPIAPVPTPLAPPLISDSVEGTGGPVNVNGVLLFLEPVEPAAPAAPPAPRRGDARTGYTGPAGCSAAYPASW